MLLYLGGFNSFKRLCTSFGQQEHILHLGSWHEDHRKLNLSLYSIPKDK